MPDTEWPDQPAQMHTTSADESEPRPFLDEDRPDFDDSPFGVAQRALIEGRRDVNLKLEALRKQRAKLNEEIRQLVAEDKRLAQALTPFDREARKRSAT